MTLKEKARAWVKTYDISGKKICTLSKQSVCEVINERIQ